MLYVEVVIRRDYGSRAFCFASGRWKAENLKAGKLTATVDRDHGNA
jgi:hypothetical protein